MIKPPVKIDNAEVLYWAWSSVNPFGVIKNVDESIEEEIYGLAICRYSISETIYRFSCDKEWETKQDCNYSSIEEAMELLPIQ